MRRKKQEASRTLLVAAALILGAALAQPLIAQDRGTAKARGDARAAARFDQYFRKYGKRYFGVGYDWRRFKAQAMAESNMDSTATSAVGARGLMQLMPATARWVAGKLGLKNFNPAQVTAIDTNATLGTWYLRRVLDRRRAPEFDIQTLCSFCGCIRHAKLPHPFRLPR